MTKVDWPAVASAVRGAATPLQLSADQDHFTLSGSGIHRAGTLEGIFGSFVTEEPEQPKKRRGRPPKVREDVTDEE